MEILPTLAASEESQVQNLIISCVKPSLINENDHIKQVLAHPWNMMMENRSNPLK